MKTNKIIAATGVISLMAPMIVVATTSCNSNEKPQNVINNDLDDIESAVKEYVSKYPEGLKPNSLGEQQIIDNISKENIRKYVDELPNEMLSNGVTTNIISIERKTDKKLVVTINFEKNSISKILTKEINGFRTKSEQDNIDIEDVNKVMSQDFNLAVTETGRKVKSTDVNLNNAHDYIKGWPESTDEVKINVVDVYAKTKDINDIDNNNIVIVELSFTKNLYVATKKIEVYGFLTPTQEDIFNRNASRILVRTTEKASSICGIEVNLDNINDYILVWNNEKLYDVKINSIKRGSSDWSQLRLNISITDKSNGMTKSKEEYLFGFKTDEDKSKENLEKLYYEYSALTTNSSITKDKFSYDVARGAIKLEEIFPNYPKDLDFIDVSHQIKYSKTDKSLLDTEMQVIWTLKNKVTSEVKTVSKKIEGFIDPYWRYKIIGDINAVALKDNTNHSFEKNGWNQVVKLKGYGDVYAGTYQNTWVEWGEYQVTKDYRNNSSNWRNALPSLLKPYMDRFIGSDRITYRYLYGDSIKKIDWDRSKKEVDFNAAWCNNKVIIAVTREGYNEIQVKLNLRVALYNAYWK